MPLLEDAIQFAIEAHLGRYRKFDNTPYIRHPLAVMGILSDIYTSHEVLAAAVLHDTVEDIDDVSLEIIHERFGEVVAGYVFFATEKSTKKDGNRAIRKEIDRRHYSNGPKEAQDIKVADMLDNIPGFVLYDPIFSKMYINEKMQLLGVLHKADTSLKIKALNLISNMYLCLEKIK